MFCRTPQAPAGTQAPTAELPGEAPATPCPCSHRRVGTRHWQRDDEKEGDSSNSLCPFASQDVQWITSNFLYCLQSRLSQGSSCRVCRSLLRTQRGNGQCHQEEKKKKSIPPKKTKSMRWVGHRTTMVVLCHVLSVVFLAEQFQGHFLGHPNPIFSTFFNFKVMPKNHYPDKGMRTTRLYYYYYYYCWFYYYCCCCYCYCFHVTVGHSETGGRNLNKHPT